MLSQKQRGVLTGMVAAVVASILGIGAAVIFAPRWLLAGGPFPATLAFSLKWDVAVAFCLAASIGALARHRFFTPEDIDGGGLSPGTAKAHILQSTLQNTLEQTVLAVGVHSAWAVAMPAVWLSAVPAAVALFVIGRVLFWRGYGKGAAARSFGFALTFYPSILMLLAIIVYLVRGVFV